MKQDKINRTCDDKEYADCIAQLLDNLDNKLTKNFNLTDIKKLGTNYDVLPLCPQLEQTTVMVRFINKKLMRIHSQLLELKQGRFIDISITKLYSLILAGYEYKNLDIVGIINPSKLTIYDKEMSIKKQLDGVIRSYFKNIDINTIKTTLYDINYINQVDKLSATLTMTHFSLRTMYDIKLEYNRGQFTPETIDILQYNYHEGFVPITINVTSLFFRQT